MEAQVITVTTKGQIAIPIKIRKMLSIENGDKLVAYVYGDTLMLKVLKIPSEEEFKNTLDNAQKWATSVGYSETDVNKIIKATRKNDKE